MVRGRTKRGDNMFEASIVLDFKRINGKIHKALLNSIRKYNLDITPVQGRIITFIHESKEVTATDILNEFKSVNKSTLSGILNNLEKNNYIKRVESNVDSRKKILVLTDKAKDVIKVLKNNFDQAAHSFLKDVTIEEFDLFKTVLNKMERNIDELC